MKNSKREDYKIAIILGTRAELIKVFPVMKELTERKIPYYFIHSGQHNLGELCELFSIKKPDVVMTKEPKKSSKFNSGQLKAIIWNLGLIWKIKRELKKLPRLKYVIYHGDTMTTASSSIATSKILNPFKKYKNVHLEAGLRSFNNFEPFPEEISRLIAGRFSELLIAVSEKSKENLKKFKKKEIVLLGNTIIDSANISLKIAKSRKVKALNRGKFALITVHRHENLRNKERLEKIVEILSHLKIPSYFAIHDNTLKKFEDFNLLNKLKENKNIHLIKPLDYPSFIYQVSKCSLIVCDGGSMQEESLIFEKPCIILRKATERPEGLDTNFQFLSKLNILETKRKIDEFLSSRFILKKSKNPYGNLGLSKKIVRLLESEINNES